MPFRLIQRVLDLIVTRLMKDKIFLDSNILIYSYSSTEPDKQIISRELIKLNDTYISTQVLQELTNTITRKLKFSYTDAINVINESEQNNNLHINTKNTVLKACSIAGKYGFSFYDSLIISAALESGCQILYTEDLHHNQTIEGKLKIVNPFV